MTTAQADLIERARTLGGNAADAYCESTDCSPAEDWERVGDWDSSAWSLHWRELVDAGASDTDYEACLTSWRAGFWGTDSGFYTEGDGLYYKAKSGRAWLLGRDGDGEMPAPAEVGGLPAGAKPAGHMLTTNQCAEYYRRIGAVSGEMPVEG